ncbi:MAG: PTS sugar transporter subunit IIB, partial [Lacticaseibacillus rhamnosus]
KAKADDKKIPMAVIDMKAYGMMDGEKVLRQALGLLDQKV